MQPTLAEAITLLQPLDETAQAAARERQGQLTKPPGSLGRLEDLAVQLAGITGQAQPRMERRAIIVMAGDHGVAAEGVSAYPSAVTAQMVLNFLAGGAAINALARHIDARVVVVDVGVASEVTHKNLIARKVAPGTADMSRGPAMTRVQAEAAINVGLAVVADEIARGLDIVGTGEMGIGNTTAASAITAAFSGLPVADLTGYGTGLNEEGRQHKIAVIEQALATNQPDPADPLDVLAKVGGLEIAGLVGVILGAAAGRVPVVIDGFISGAAALVAARLAPATRDYMIAGHRSVERGHGQILSMLGLTPLLDLNLRLGEGTGAALAMEIVAAAARAHREMATFAEAEVSNREDAPE
jgi:nicotinate-nucleotide--dimethylbenzimidazole phosphoribosyltransferase